MKKVILSLAIFMAGLSCFAQAPLAYSEVVNVDNATRSDLYDRVDTWFKETSKKTGLSYEKGDQSSETIEGEGFINYVVPYFLDIGFDTNITYKIAIFIKDGKYKYEISSFYHKSIYTSQTRTPLNLGILNDVFVKQKTSLPKGLQKKQYDRALKEIDILVKSYIETLKKTMSEPVNNSLDW